MLSIVEVRRDVWIRFLRIASLGVVCTTIDVLSLINFSEQLLKLKDFNEAFELVN